MHYSALGVGIQENLTWARRKLHQLTLALLERGATLSVLEAHGQALLDSSNHFVTLVVPWYKRAWFRLQRTCGSCICIGSPRIIDVSAIRGMEDDADANKYAAKTMKKKHMDNGMVEL